MRRKVLLPYYRLLGGFALLALFSAAQARELPDFTGLVEQNSAAVVNISTTQKESKRPQFSPKQMPDLPQGTPWDDLFKHFFGEEGEGPGPEEAARRMCEDVDVRVGERTAQPAGHLGARLLERAVDGSHDQVELGEELV